MKNLFKRLVEFGITDEISLDEVKRIRLANTISIAMVINTFVMSSVLMVVMGSKPLGILLTCICLSSFIPPLLNRMKYYVASKVIFAFIVMIDVSSLVVFIGKEMNLQYYYFSIFAFPILLFGNTYKILSRSLIVLAIGSFVIIEYYAEMHDPLLTNVPEDQFFLKMANNGFIMFLLLIETTFFLNENLAHLKKLEDLTESLKVKNKELEHFAYIASHDLQEPLKTVEGYISAVEETVENKNEETNFLFTTIYSTLSRMTSMISSLLDYSKLSGKQNLEEVDINIMLHEVQHDLQELIKKSQADITVEAMPTISCIPRGLKQAFQNLITNAVKFRKPGSVPKICIRFMETEESFRFSVEDNGIGIETKSATEIFKMYKRLHGRSEFSGYGIGLAFCQKIIENHNGKIWVESEFGKGSTFHFTIPK